jgi:hypothetical protein
VKLFFWFALLGGIAGVVMMFVIDFPNPLSLGE